jgi:hypothetical protein
MTSIKERYSELLALTQLYLLQEHQRGEWIASDPETYAYFKQAVQKPRGAGFQPANVEPASSRLTATGTPMPPKDGIPPTAKKTFPADNATPATLLSSTNSTHTAPSKKVPVATAGRLEAGTTTTDSKPTPKPEQSASEAKSKTFALEPLAAATAINLDDIRSIVTERFPNLEILNHIPSYEKAKQQGSTTANVLVLALNESPQNLAFLSNLAKAINVQLTSAMVVPAESIESESRWEAILTNKQLQLIIASEQMITQLPKLKQFYRQESNKHYVSQTACLLLVETSRYLKEPQLKPLLWANLCEMLK